MQTDSPQAALEVREVYQGPQGKQIIVARLVSGQPRDSMILRSQESGDHWRVWGGGVLAGSHVARPGETSASSDKHRQGLETLVLERVDGNCGLHTGERLLAAS